MKRRPFIKSCLAVSGGLLVRPPLNLLSGACAQSDTSRIVIARDPRLQPGLAGPDSDRLGKLLDKTLQGFFDSDSAEAAWKKLFHPREVIGLKVNCLSGRGGGTHPELVMLICERLQANGLPPENIVIWDRLNEDLEDGGFQINIKGSRIKCLGNDSAGFAPDFEIFGSAASLVTKTLTDYCDAVINLPVLKDHGIAGVTVSLKNMFGAIHNPNKYHLNVGDPYIADVFMLPSIRNKIRFTICDAIQAQYQGGPSYMPQWSWPFNGLLAGSDPVALDYTGWQIIEEQRRIKGLKSLTAEKREPAYIATAADTRHRLGTNNPDLIEKIVV
jgi:uncharacterized protein (DUF362 family)